MIHAGALHRANGGFLLVDALDVLREQGAWEALVRALTGRTIRIEPPEPQGATPAIETLDPAPIPLDVTVVVFGNHALFAKIAEVDPRLRDVFTVLADFDPAMERTRENEVAYANLLAATARERGLLPVDELAIARVVEHASRISGDACKLSLDRRSLANVLAEADAHARRSGHGRIQLEDIERTLDAQNQRSGRLEEQYLEAIRRDMVVLSTSGQKIGQINALAVVETSERPIGIVRRITVRTRLGAGEVVDIERETELGGPFHSKGILILSGFLGARFGVHQPLTMAATIVFEQSYEGVDGDSASLAELCAPLSAIGAVPLRQELAVTGSIDQYGEVQPVGNVNEKIEAFFNVCNQRGLTRNQGVIIPRRNVTTLMLRRDVVDAVRAGLFHVHSVNAQVEHRLAEFADDTHRFARNDRQRARSRWSVPPGSS